MSACLVDPREASPQQCHNADLDVNNDVDLSAFAAFTVVFAGSGD